MIESLVNSVQRSRKTVAFVFSAFILSLLAPAAQATSFVNGTFSTTNTTGLTPTYHDTANGGQLGYNINAAGWTAAGGGFNLLFTSGANAVAGIVDQYASAQNSPNFSLYGTALGASSPNGLASTAVPGGGNIVGLDGAFGVKPLEQTITGLTLGHQYAVSFQWAGAQQSGYTGATTEQLQVYFGANAPTIAVGANGYDYSFGSNFDSTAILSNPQGGFTGWNAATFNFTATSASEVLGFLAVGTPNGEPPISLLTDVSFTDVTPPPPATPEPGTLPLFVTGLVGGIGVLRSRNWRKK
jgi:hypothetical protein